MRTVFPARICSESSFFTGLSYNLSSFLVAERRGTRVGSVPNVRKTPEFSDF
jgi:hypothetical protein